MPSFFLTSAGTEIWPCIVSFDFASIMMTHYHGNEIRTTGQMPATGRAFSSQPSITRVSLGVTCTEGGGTVVESCPRTVWERADQARERERLRDFLQARQKLRSIAPRLEPSP